MRLGDLDALKEDLKQYFSDGTLDSVSAKLAFNMILRKIDEAPTVKTYCYFCGQTEHGKIEEIPQGDLISRSALKEIAYINKGNFNTVEGIRDWIDNALTVEPFEPDYVGAERLKARQRGYEEGYHNGMAIGKTLNPKIKQGEWIDYSNEGYVECPFCGSATNCEDNKDELHYCWNCGAEMKGGAE